MKKVICLPQFGIENELMTCDQFISIIESKYAGSEEKKTEFLANWLGYWDKVPTPTVSQNMVNSIQWALSIAQFNETSYRPITPKGVVWKAYVTPNGVAKSHGLGFVQKHTKPYIPRWNDRFLLNGEKNPNYKIKKA